VARKSWSLAGGRFVGLAASVIAALVAGLFAGTAISTGEPTARALAAQHVPAHGSLLAEVRRELTAMNTSRYQHQIEVNEKSGQFDYDCSGLIDYALESVDPAAYRVLPVSTTRPLAQDIAKHIRHVGHSATSDPWQQVRTVAELRPGDVVSWLTPPDSDSDNTGHVMVALDAPTKNSERTGEWLVRVADSTTSPHAQDSRTGGTNGLGTGTIGLVAGDSGQPIGYYWRGGTSTHLEHTAIALGRIN